MGRVPNVCQTLVDTLLRSDPCPIHQIIRHSQVKLVCCGKTCVSSQGHYIVLTHAVGKPISQGCIPETVECSLSDTRHSQDTIKLPREVVDYLQSGISECPPALFPQMLNMVISGRRNKHIRTAFWLPCLMVGEHLDDIPCQRQSVSRQQKWHSLSV